MKNQNKKQQEQQEEMSNVGEHPKEAMEPSGWAELMRAIEKVKQAPPSKEALVDALMELIPPAFFLIGNESYDDYLDMVAGCVRSTWTPPNEPGVGYKDMDPETVQKFSELKSACERAVRMVNRLEADDIDNGNENQDN
jgi:hypothetical protein